MDSYILKTFIVEFFLLSSVLFILLYNAYLITSSSYNFPILDNETFIQSLFILFISFLLSVGNDFGGLSALSLFSNDISAISVKTIIIVATIGSLICGKPYFIKKKINLFEYYILVLLALFSLLFLTAATDFMTIYLCLEMQSLCFYVLAAFNRYSVFSTEAGLKYFVIGVFCSCIFLLGSSLLYGMTGTTNLNNIALLLTNLPIGTATYYFLIAGILFLLITILFKLAAVPFHVWSPDVYEGSPLNSTIIFVLVPKTVFLFLIFRLFYSSFFDVFLPFKEIFLICGVLSVLVGTFLALKQKRLKKLLVYSSISHVGFMLLGFSTGTLLGITAVFYYMIFYIITGFLVWGILSLFYHDNKGSLYLTDFAALIKTNPALALAFALSFFSLAGIPPLVGFSMKFFIFSAAMEANLYGVSLLIILLSVIGSFYYLRFIKIIFFEKHNIADSFITINKTTEKVYSLVAFSLIVILVGFIDPTFILLYSYKIALGAMIF